MMQVDTNQPQQENKYPQGCH